MISYREIERPRLLRADLRARRKINNLERGHVGEIPFNCYVMQNPGPTDPSRTSRAAGLN